LIIPSSPSQAFSLTQPKGMEGSVVENVLDVDVDYVE